MVSEVITGSSQGDAWHPSIFLLRFCPLSRRTTPHSPRNKGHTHTLLTCHNLDWAMARIGLQKGKRALLLMHITKWCQGSPMWLFWGWRQLARRLIVTSRYHVIFKPPLWPKTCLLLHLQDRSQSWHPFCSQQGKNWRQCGNHGIPGNCQFSWGSIKCFVFPPQEWPVLLGSWGTPPISSVYTATFHFHTSGLRARELQF